MRPERPTYNSPGQSDRKGAAPRGAGNQLNMRPERPTYNSPGQSDRKGAAPRGAGIPTTDALQGQKHSTPFYLDFQKGFSKKDFQKISEPQAKSKDNTSYFIVDFQKIFSADFYIILSKIPRKSRPQIKGRYLCRFRLRLRNQKKIKRKIYSKILIKCGEGWGEAPKKSSLTRS